MLLDAISSFLAHSWRFGARPEWKKSGGYWPDAWKGDNIHLNRIDEKPDNLVAVLTFADGQPDGTMRNPASIEYARVDLVVRHCDSKAAEVTSKWLHRRFMESFPNGMSRFNYVEPLGIPTREEDDEKDRVSWSSSYRVTLVNDKPPVPWLNRSRRIS